MYIRTSEQASFFVSLLRNREFPIREGLKRARPRGWEIVVLSATNEAFVKIYRYVEMDLKEPLLCFRH